MGSGPHRRFELGTFFIGLGALAAAAYLIGLSHRQEVRRVEADALGLSVHAAQKNRGSCFLFDPMSTKYVLVGMYVENLEQVLRPLGISRSAAHRIDGAVMQTGGIVWNDDGAACYFPFPWTCNIGARSLVIGEPVLVTVGGRWSDEVRAVPIR